MYQEPGYYYKRPTHPQLTEANNDAYTSVRPVYHVEAKYEELR